MRTIRSLLGWELEHVPPSAEDIRKGRAFFVQKGRRLEAVLVRPEDAEALGSNVDGLSVEMDDCVTPGCVFFVVAE